MSWGKAEKNSSGRLLASTIVRECVAHAGALGPIVAGAKTQTSLTCRPGRAHVEASRTTSYHSHATLEVSDTWARGWTGASDDCEHWAGRFPIRVNALSPILLANRVTRQSNHPRVGVPGGPPAAVGSTCSVLPDTSWWRHAGQGQAGMQQVPRCPPSAASVMGIGEARWDGRNEHLSTEAVSGRLQDRER